MMKYHTTIKEVIVLNKKRGKKMIIFVFVMLFIYYVYVLFATNGIMQMAKKVAAGEVIVDGGTPYARFSPGSEYKYTCDIRRYFAYCGIKKGKIFVTCVNVMRSSDGKVYRGRDYFEVLIEKTEDGKWEAVGTFGEP